MSDALAGPEPSTTAGTTPVARRLKRPRLTALAGASLLIVALLLAILVHSSAPVGPAQLVPADALGFIDISLARGSSALGDGLTVAHRFPDFPRLSGSVESRVASVLTGGKETGLALVLPWAGPEAAVALLNTTTATAGSLIILAVRSRAGARAFLAHEGASPQGTYRGTKLYRYPSGAELAFVSHYLIAGQDASVRAAVDVESGAPSLAESSVYQRVIAPQPDRRVLSAYASSAGVRRLLSPRGGIVGALGDLLYQPALQGVALGLAPRRDGMRLLIHSALDPTLQRLAGSRVSFDPTLQNELPAGSIFMIDVHGLNRAAPALLSAGITAGIGGGIASLLSRLGSALGAEGVDVHQITSLFSGETAVSVVPNGRSEPLVVVSRVPNMAQARNQLAQLEIPLAQLFHTPNATKVPVFNDVSVAGITDHQLSLASGLELDYAVFRGMVVISTAVAGVAAVAAHTHSLAQDPGYRSVLPAHPTRVSSLTYMSLPKLVALGQSTELISGAGFRRLAPDLAAIADAGMIASRSSGQSSVALSLRLPGAPPVVGSR